MKQKLYKEINFLYLYGRLQESGKAGFQKCRTDIEVLNTSNSEVKEEVSYLREENRELRKLVTDMNSQMNELKAELKGVTIALDYIRNFNGQSSQATIMPQQAVVQEPIVKKEKKQAEYKDPYEALLAFKARSNKKEYIKEKMLQLLEENDGMVLPELKFLLVDHFKYCSKASFYNYLREIEIEKYIKIDRVGGKNKVYLASPSIVSQDRIENIN